MSETLRAHLAQQLEEICHAGTYKRERILSTPQGTFVRVADGKPVLNLCANNYLGLAQHPEIAKRLRDKLTAWSMELHPPGLDNAALSMAAQHYYDYYLDGKPYLPVEKQGKKGKAAGGDGDSE